MYASNPKRGCGTKKYDSFYAEADMSPGGALAAWCWLLGDGLLAGDLMPVEIPPRGMVVINPAATITLRELYLADGRFEPSTSDEAELYTHYKNRTKHIGVGDHVGADSYTAHSFANEVMCWGPSRKMSPEMAKLLAHVIYQVGPVPVLFTHSRVPVFSDDEHRDEILALIEAACAEYIKLPEYIGQNYNYEATWLHVDFGMSARRNHYTGQDHYMREVLKALDMIDRQWSEVKMYDTWQTLRDKMSQLVFIEQAVGLSWLTRVSYTLPKDGQSKHDPKLLASIEGLHIIDLDADQPEDGDNE